MLPWLEIFGATLTLISALTSAGMILFASHWQVIEGWAYGGTHRPWPVWLLGGVLLCLWALGLADIILHPTPGHAWAGWSLAIGVPALWAVKSVALVFNARGRAAVSAISDPRNWRLIGLARLPIAIILAMLTCLARPNF